MSRARLVHASLAIAFVILPAATFAQEVGVKAGLNFASLTPLEDEDPDIGLRLGPVAGVWVRLPTDGRVTFQGEALFSKKGSHWEFPGFAAWEYRGPDHPPLRHVEPLVFENVHLQTRSYR